MSTPAPQPVDVPSASHLTARDAAERLGVNERTIRRAIARGELPATKHGGTFHIALAELERFRVRRESPPRPESGRQPPFTSRASLPTPLTSLVGREAVIEVLAASLHGPERLVTLTGPGGVGKTRLALAVASVLAASFADGVYFVPLAALSDPGQVGLAIADALGVQESGAVPLAERLVASLHDRRVLLVLDNFETVMEVAPLISTLLTGSPLLKILVASRVRLHLSGECVRPVTPLSVDAGDTAVAVGPATTRTRPGFAGPCPSPAAQLFIERAHAVRRDMVSTPEDITLVEAICRQLDGLPLAIELATARVNMLPLPDLLQRLERRLPLLTGGPRDAPQRLRAMRDAIGWSYDLLDEDEQRLFRCLAIFAGGFTLAAAEGVGPPGSPTFDVLASLVDKSLVSPESTDGGETRYRLLETLREFGLEQLGARGEQDEVAQRHARWYLEFAVDAGPRAKMADAPHWLPRLRAEQRNFHAALDWFHQVGDGASLVRMAGSLWPFWQEQNHCAEGLRWLELALALGPDAPVADRLRALAGAGTLAWYLTRVAQARDWQEAALALARTAGDAVAEAQALGNRAWLHAEDGDLEAAITDSEASLRLAREVGVADPTALVLHNLACFTRMNGDPATGSVYAAEALALARKEGWEWLVTMILVGFGYTTLELGDAGRASALLREALELGVARGDRVDVTMALEGLANVAAVCRQPVQAVRLFGAASGLRDEIGMPMSPSERAYFEPLTDELRDTLGAERFAAAWEAGRALPQDAAVAAGLVQSPSTVPAAPAPRLTTRERDVLRELVAGKSNQEIAGLLFINPTTVATHVASIYRKLGVESRAEAIAWAYRQGDT